jgi:arabinofuranosyltransferase
MQRSRAKTWVIVLGGLIVLGAYVVHVGAYWPQINDDAFITFRYSKFLTLGRGPYFNIGEHVEGYTNFLMMLLMAGAIALFGDNEVLFVAKLVGLAGGVVAILATWALCARWLRKLESMKPHAELLAWAAAALVATNCAYAFNSTTGLETTLFSAWVMLGLWLVQKGCDEQRYRAAGVAFALAALTRPEGGAIFAAALVGRLIAAEWRTRAGRRALGLDVLIVAAVVAGHSVFRYTFYDGELLPNTFYAKRDGFMQSITAAEYVLRFGHVLLATVVPLLALFPLAARGGAVRRGVAPALFVAWASAAAVFATGAGWMPGYRLLVPYVPAWAGLAVCGIAAVADHFRRDAVAIAGGASLLLLGGLFWWQELPRKSYYEYALIRAEGYVAGHAALADWLNEQSKPGDAVALMDIGIVSFKCIDLRILDITGLTDRYVAKSPGGFLTKQFDPAYVFDQRPEYFVIAVRGPAGPIDAEAARQLRPWTKIEERMLGAPAFHEHYVRGRQPATGASELEWLAGVFGADRAFRHHYPGANYLLFAYRYHEVPTSLPAGAAAQPS